MIVRTAITADPSLEWRPPVRNATPRLLHIHQRKATGEELPNTLAQIPPGVDWKDGWGFENADVDASPSKLTFSIHGGKAKDLSAPSMYNQGRHHQRVVLEASLPVREE